MDALNKSFWNCKKRIGSFIINFVSVIPLILVIMIWIFLIMSIIIIFLFILTNLFIFVNIVVERELFFDSELVMLFLYFLLIQIKTFLCTLRKGTKNWYKRLVNNLKLFLKDPVRFLKIWSEKNYNTKSEYLLALTVGVLYWFLRYCFSHIVIKIFPGWRWHRINYFQYHEEIP